MRIAKLSYVGTKVYISVGWGNIGIDMNEVSQRGALLGALQKQMRGFDMDPKSLELTQLLETGVWIKEADIEVGCVIGNFSKNTLKKIWCGIIHEKCRKPFSQKEKKKTLVCFYWIFFVSSRTFSRDPSTIASKFPQFLPIL